MSLFSISNPWVSLHCSLLLFFILCSLSSPFSIIFDTQFSVPGPLFFVLHLSCCVVFCLLFSILDPQSLVLFSLFSGLCSFSCFSSSPVLSSQFLVLCLISPNSILCALSSFPYSLSSILSLCLIVTRT